MLAAVSAAESVASFTLSVVVSRPRSGEESLPLTPKKDARFAELGSDVKEGKLSDRTPIMLLRCSTGAGWSGGFMQGERRYSSQVLTSKKSTS